MRIRTSSEVYADRRDAALAVRESGYRLLGFRAHSRLLTKLVHLVGEWFVNAGEQRRVDLIVRSWNNSTKR